MKKVLFIKNAVILTATSLALRFFGIVFKVWLAKRIGAEGMGLYQLIFSVYVLASAFVTSGVSMAVTRLTAEDLARGKNPLPQVKKAVLLTLLAAFASILLLYFGARPVAALLGDARAVPALKILPFSLPFMGVSACLRGYYIARRHVVPNALSQLLEQLLRLGSVFLLLSRFAAGGLAVCCRAVLIGDVSAEAGACLLICLFLHFDKKRLISRFGTAPKERGGFGKLLHIALPVSSGRCLNTALRTAETVLVPQKLAAYSADPSDALSQFGRIKGMALPVLLFPATLLSAVSTLLIPEISEAAAKGRRGIVKSTSQYILKLTAVMSFLCGAVFWAAGEEIGLLLYGEKEAGFLLKALAPLVPLMYLENVSDGILKGLDQQGFIFRTSVSDSLLRIGLVAALLPSFGLSGFLWIMYFSNLLTCGLNVGRLLRVSGARPKIFSDFLLPLCCAVTASFCCRFAADRIPGLPSPIRLGLFLAACFAVYAVFLFSFGILQKEDLARLTGR